MTNKQVKENKEQIEKLKTRLVRIETLIWIVLSMNGIKLTEDVINFFAFLLS